MEIRVNENEDHTVIALHGEIDLSGSPEVRTAILGQLGQQKDVLVDLSNTSYIDSSGVACLVEGMQTAKKDGRGFALLQTSMEVLRVLQLARLDKVFQLVESVEEYREKSEG